MGVRFQRVSAEAAAEAEKSMTNVLVVPADARRAKKDPATAYWTERVKITDATAEETLSNGNNHVKLEVSGTIMETRPNGDTSDNVGRTATMRNRLNWDAAAKADPKDGQFKMHRGTVARAGQLFRVAGLYGGGVIEPELWEHVFPAVGTSPLAGLEVDVEIKQGPNDKGDVFPEISKIILPDDIAVPEDAATTNGVTTL